MYFELLVYFLRNTLLNSLLVAPTFAKKIWFIALHLPYWARYEYILMHPPAGVLQACWGPNTTPVVTAISDVILKPVQSDLASDRLYSDQISGL